MSKIFKVKCYFTEDGYFETLFPVANEEEAKTRAMSYLKRYYCNWEGGEVEFRIEETNE